MTNKSSLIFSISLILGLSFIGLIMNIILSPRIQNSISDSEENLINTSDSWTFDDIEILITNDNWSENSVDWIQVHNGTVDDPHIIENITINKELMYGKHCIRIENSRDFFIIRHCSIRYAGIMDHSGIYLKNASNGLIKNNWLKYNNGPSISLINSTNITIFDNELCYNDDDAIFLENSSNNRIESNFFGECYGGINLESNSNNNTIFDNQITGIIYDGIRINDDSRYNNITKNWFWVGLGGLSYAILIIDSDYNYISENNINYFIIAIIISDSNHLMIENNQIQHCYDTSISASAENDPFIENITIHGNVITQSYELTISNGTNCIISNNILYDMGVQYYSKPIMIVTYSNNMEIFGNFINSTIKDAMRLLYCDYITTCNNTILNSDNGLELINSNYCLINDTTISKCNSGIYIENANNNNITNSQLNYNNYSIVSQGSNSNNLFENITRYTFLEDSGIHNFEIIPYGFADFNITINLNITDTTEILAESLDHARVDVILDNLSLFIEIELNDTANLIGDINVTIDGPFDLIHSAAWWFNESANSGLGGWEELNLTLLNGDIILTVNHSSIYGITMDSSSPTWFTTPNDQLVEYGTPFSYNVIATDNIGIHDYWINDTVNFNIDSNGLITNNAKLFPGEYWLLIRAYDSYDNYCEVIIRITVSMDSGSPYISIPGYDWLFLFNSSFTLILVILLLKKRKFN